jgi:hypothetical protein
LEKIEVCPVVEKEELDGSKRSKKTGDSQSGRRRVLSDAIDNFGWRIPDRRPLM